MSIPGYLNGNSALARSPVSLADFELLRKTVLSQAILWTQPDVRDGAF